MRSSLWCYIWRHGIIFNVQWPHFKCCWVCFLHFANSVFKPCFFPFFFTLSRKDFFNLGSWLLQCSKWQKHHAAALVFFIFAITVILIYAAVLPDQSRKICSFQKLLWLMCGLDESRFLNFGWTCSIVTLMLTVQKHSVVESYDLQIQDLHFFLFF